ncbi:MAG: hypothetical protein QW618_03815 [Nitrososphaerales archaeon]
MTKYFIFVIKDHIEGKKIIPASEVLSDRVKYGFWSLSSKKSILQIDKIG